MKKNIFLMVAFFSVYTFAQTRNSNDNFGVQNGTLILNSNSIDTTPNEKEYIGDYKVGKVDGFTDQVSYRYNALNDDFEFIEGNKRRALQKTTGLKINFVDGSRYEVLNYTDSNENFKTGYLQVLTDPNQKFILYKLSKVSTSQALNKNSYDGSVGGTNYRTEYSYFLGDADRIAYLPKSAKKIESIFKVNIQDLVKTNKLNLNKEQDLIQFVNLLNK